MVMLLSCLLELISSLMPLFSQVSDNVIPTCGIQSSSHLHLLIENETVDSIKKILVSVFHISTGNKHKYEIFVTET